MVPPIDGAHGRSGDQWLHDIIAKQALRIKELEQEKLKLYHDGSQVKQDLIDAHEEAEAALDQVPKICGFFSSWTV